MWCHDQPSCLRVETPRGDAIRVEPGRGQHPLFGPVDRVVDSRGRLLTEVGRIDWRIPGHIPPLARPGRLPRGAGTALLNVLARNAPGPLRYRGPYPSAALFESLTSCFRVADGDDERFLAGAEVAAVRGETVEPPVDFVPAPFRRWRVGRVCVQERDEVVERIYVDGLDFRRDAVSGRCLLESGPELVAALVVGSRPVLELVRLDRRSGALGELAEPPPLAAEHLDRPLPAPVARAIWAAVSAGAPELLRPGIAALARDTTLVWGDPGLALAAPRDGRIALHAAFADADLSPARLLVEMTQAVVPVAWRLAQRRLEEVVD